jgi:hypothetical protein
VTVGRLVSVPIGWRGLGVLCPFCPQPVAFVAGAGELARDLFESGGENREPHVVIKCLRRLCSTIWAEWPSCAVECFKKAFAGGVCLLHRCDGALVGHRRLQVGPVCDVLVGIAPVAGVAYCWPGSHGEQATP